MFYHRDEFVDLLDVLIPEEIQNKYTPPKDTKVALTELYLLEERARCEAIKKIISKTHIWTRATSLEADGFIKDIFICQDCGLRASIFTHIARLSIIEKINDNLPTYTVHNEYIMYNCGEMEELNARYSENHKCLECWMPREVCDFAQRIQR